MSKRFGRNQRRKMREQVEHAQSATLSAQRELVRAQNKLVDVLRHQNESGRIPLAVECFIDPREMNLVMHAIFDERRANLHYQHAIGPHEMRKMSHDREREMFGLYLGRAIADKLAAAYAGRMKQ